MIAGYSHSELTLRKRDILLEATVRNVFHKIIVPMVKSDVWSFQNKPSTVPGVVHQDIRAVLVDIVTSTVPGTPDHNVKPLKVL